MLSESEVRERTVPALLVAGGVAAPSAQAASSRTSPRVYMSRGGIALLMLAAMASVAALHVARAFFIPLTVGILLSYSLRPVVDWFAVRHVPRALTAAVVLAALVAGLGWSTMSLRDDAAAIVDKLPEAARKERPALTSALRDYAVTRTPTLATFVVQAL
ncbi:MAG: AI-2E family transporter, partial [Burkholderiales bacterium]